MPVDVSTITNDSSATSPSSFQSVPPGPVVPLCARKAKLEPENEAVVVGAAPVDVSKTVDWLPPPPSSPPPPQPAKTSMNGRASSGVGGRRGPLAKPVGGLAR